MITSLLGDFLRLLWTGLVDTVIDLFPFKYYKVMPGEVVVWYKWGSYEHFHSADGFTYRWGFGWRYKTHWIYGNYSQTDELHCMTRDRVPLLVGLVAVYDIFNSYKFYRREDTPALVSEKLEASVVEAISGLNFTECDPESLTTLVAADLASIEELYGVEFEDIRFQRYEIDSELVKGLSAAAALSLTLPPLVATLNTGGANEAAKQTGDPV